MNPPEEISKTSTSKEILDLAEFTLEGKWDKVIEMYKDVPETHTAIINDTQGTALHVAVELYEEHVVQVLLRAIIKGCPTESRRIEALEVRNKRGDTPLHVAAARGFARICKLIIEMESERKYLIILKNEEGETPLFQAAINGNEIAFAYLSTILGEDATLGHLLRLNGDSILHCAISREYFDLALTIVHHYDFLITHVNKEGFTALRVLASRPSAFRSTSKFSWWKQILYHCILVEPLNVTKQMKANLAEMEKQPNSDEVNNYPKNYATLYDFFAGLLSVAALVGKKKNDTENPSMNKQSTIQLAGFLPPNYETLQQFVRSAYVHILGLLGVELKEVKKAKQRHEWGDQLLKALMKNRPYAAFTGIPKDIEPDTDMYSVYNLFKQGGETSFSGSLKQESDEKKYNETALLIAARNGIVEMVDEILNRVPSAISETNSEKENALLVAVKSRQLLVVEHLKIKMQSKPIVWNNLILAVNVTESTVLHLAGSAADDKPRKVPGSALQMMWDVKWFQYIKSLVPPDLYARRDRNAKTAGEIFEEAHQWLTIESDEWLKDTSESCSVVAGLVAGVAFATAATIPGGTNNDGRPNLEGKTAFNVFAIASLLGLCFSVTGLIMFLALVTSRKEMKDFRKDLPIKLLIGLGSLFVSIAAMLVSFWSGNFFLYSHRYKIVLYPIYAATCVPVTLFVMAQFPLYFDLLAIILKKMPPTSDKRDRL